MFEDILQEVFVLGAPDPEMRAVERLVRQAGIRVVQARSRGKAVIQRTAYEVDHPGHVPGMVWVECRPRGIKVTEHLGKVFDHHNPGDFGTSIGPEGFFEGSSLGQVIAYLARGRIERLPAWRVSNQGVDANPGQYLIDENDEWWVCVGQDQWKLIPRGLLYVAAVDHCGPLAFRGRCPGVDPEALLVWRAEDRARAQGRGNVKEMLELTRQAFRVAPKKDFGGKQVADLRGPFCARCGTTESSSKCSGVQGHHVVKGGLPDALDVAWVLGVGFIAEMKDDRGSKVVIDGCGKESPLGEDPVKHFMEWARRSGWSDVYGKPSKGFAGARPPESTIGGWASESV
jgi:hypothetical protein